MSPQIFRSLTPDDVGELMAFHDRCSERTHYLRFFAAKPHLRHDEAEYACATDQRARGAVVVTSRDDCRAVHGVGSWDRVTDDVAEVAFVLEDDYQGCGIGHALVSEVLTKAHVAGYHKAIGDYLSGNGRMRALLRHAGYHYTERSEDCGTVAFTLDLDDRSAAAAGASGNRTAAAGAGTMSVVAAKVFAECSFATAQGMEQTMTADPRHRPYVLEPAARDFWLDYHAATIPKAVKKRSWPADRQGVLLMATRLGQTAAVKALADQRNAGVMIVTVYKQNVTDATADIRKDKRCVAQAEREGGGGVYCTP